MDKYMTMILTGACTLALFLGIVLGYLIFGGDPNMAHARDYAQAQQGATVYTAAAITPTAEDTPFNRSTNELADAQSPPETHRYIVTTVDGYIAVFQAEDGNLVEVTTTPTSTFSLYELERLRNGIRIYTDEALARILQDYGS